MKHLRKIVAVVAATVIGVAALIAAPAPRAPARARYTSRHRMVAMRLSTMRIASRMMPHCPITLNLIGLGFPAYRSTATKRTRRTTPHLRTLPGMAARWWSV